MTHVAIAIVGFRNPEDVSRCITAIAASTHRDFEIVVCENGGSPAAATLRDRLGDRLPDGQRITVIDAGGNLGYAGGVARCIEASGEADAWWILNPDTEPNPGALSALLARLARGDCDMAGGVLHGPDGRIQSCGGQWRPWLARAVAIGRGRNAHDPPDREWVERRLSYVSGASMLVGRRFVETAGPMRREYFLYAEEVEWCLRGQALGLRLGFAPDARVLHRYGTTTGSAEGHRDRPRLPVYLDQRNRILVTRDCHPGKLAIAAPLALAGTFARYARRGAFRQCGYGIAGWIAGMRNQRGMPGPATNR